MVVPSQLTALNEHCSIIMTITLAFSDMSQLATMKNLYLRTIVAVFFFFFFFFFRLEHRKKRLLGYVNPLEGKKGKFKSVLIKRSCEETCIFQRKSKRAM